MKRRTLVIGLSTFDEVIKDTIEACKKARRGQVIENVNRIDFPDQESLFNILSSKRMDLLRHLRNHSSISDKQLAKQLHYDLKTVQTEIKLLARLGLIHTNNAGKYLVPWDDVTIQLPLAA